MTEQEFLWFSIKVLAPTMTLVFALIKPVRSLTTAINKLESRLDLLAIENKNQNEKLDTINKQIENAQIKMEAHSEKIINHDARIKNLERRVDNE